MTTSKVRIEFTDVYVSRYGWLMPLATQSPLLLVGMVLTSFSLRSVK